MITMYMHYYSIPPNKYIRWALSMMIDIPILVWIGYVAIILNKNIITYFFMEGIILLLLTLIMNKMRVRNERQN